MPEGRGGGGGGGGGRGSASSAAARTAYAERAHGRHVEAHAGRQRAEWHMLARGFGAGVSHQVDADARRRARMRHGPHSAGGEPPPVGRVGADDEFGMGFDLFD